MTSGLFWTNSSVSVLTLQFGLFSPVVGDEGVSGLGVRVGAHSGRTAVHIDPERNVETTKDRRLDANHVAQEEDVRLSR